MPKVQIPVNPVCVATTCSCPYDTSGFRQICDDQLNGTFSYADFLRNVAHDHGAVASDTVQYMRMVGQEGPV